MGDPKKNLMRQFKDQYYSADVSVEVFPEHGDPEYIHVDDPVTLASFVAFCSTPNRQIFLRGSADNYRRSVPSLFRDARGMQCCEDECSQRWCAYRCLVTKLDAAFTGNRWTRDDLGAVLQHYGIKTPWLDVVRNLYIAIWFSTHSLETRGARRVAEWSEQRYGWISFYDPKEISPHLEVCDLWGEHSSRHIRPHVQQGLSLAMQSDAENRAKQQDLAPYRIATVRFPTTCAWKFFGHMFSVRFLFPAPEWDDSLRELGRPVVQEILDSVCREHKLDRGALGTVTHYM